MYMNIFPREKLINIMDNLQNDRDKRDVSICLEIIPVWDVKDSEFCPCFRGKKNAIEALEKMREDTKFKLRIKYKTRETLSGIVELTMLGY